MIALILAGCGGVPSGASEAVRVREGTFVEGALPTAKDATTPAIIYAAAKAFIVTQGSGNIGYDGLATPDSWSVAVAFSDVSTGYWVVPVDGPDATQDDNLLFDLTVDFGRDVPYGSSALNFVALDRDDNPGPLYESTLCVLPDYADGNYATCAEEVPPQDTILSLRWDRPVDLDLVVVTPEGKAVTPKTPTTAVDNDGDGKLDEEGSIGVLTRDSNANCRIDNFNLESLVFESEPPAGEYQVYASLNSACGEQYVNFSATLYEFEGSADSADSGAVPWTVTQTELPHGEMVAAQADAGASLGLRLTTLTLP